MRAFIHANWCRSLLIHCRIHFNPRSKAKKSGSYIPMSHVRQAHANRSMFDLVAPGPATSQGEEHLQRINLPIQCVCILIYEASGLRAMQCSRQGANAGLHRKTKVERAQTPSHHLHGTCQGGPLKGKVFLQDPPVRLHVDGWEGTFFCTSGLFAP